MSALRHVPIYLSEEEVMQIDLIVEFEHSSRTAVIRRIVQAHLYHVSEAAMQRLHALTPIKDRRDGE